MGGINVGGTFTDLFALDERGQISIAKQPSTPQDPTEGLVGVLAKSGLAARKIRRIVHGTTIATNAMLRGAGPCCVSNYRWLGRHSFCAADQSQCFVRAGLANTSTVRASP